MFLWSHWCQRAKADFMFELVVVHVAFKIGRCLQPLLMVGAIMIIDIQADVHHNYHVLRHGGTDRCDGL